MASILAFAARGRIWHHRGIRRSCGVPPACLTRLARSRHFFDSLRRVGHHPARCTAHPSFEPAASAQLIFPHVEAPAAGTTIEVAPGILWTRLALPFLLDHVNIYFIEDGAGWTLIRHRAGRQGDPGGLAAAV